MADVTCDLFRSPVYVHVSGRVGDLVQRKHRWPDVQEGAGTNQQRRRPAGPHPQPQDPQPQEPPLIPRRKSHLPFILKDLVTSVFVSINVRYTH